MKKARIIFILLLISYILCGCRSRSQILFDDFLDHCLKEYAGEDALSLHSFLARPSSWGIREKDCSPYPDPCRAAGDDYAKAKQEMLTKLKAFDTSKLTAEQQQIAVLLRTDLEASLETYRKYPWHRTTLGKNGDAVSFALSLSRYEFRKKEDVNLYFRILEQTPAYLDRIYLYEKNRNKAGLLTSPLLLQDTSEEITSFVSPEPENNLLVKGFKERLGSIPSITDKEIESYVKDNRNIVKEKIIPAYQHLNRNLTEKLECGTDQERICQYPAGSDYYTFLLKTNVGTLHTAEECLASLKGLYTAAEEEKKDLYEEYPDLDSDYYGVLPSLSKPGDILAAQRQDTLIYFPAISSVSLEIRDLPAELSGSGIRAYYSLPPADSDTSQSLWLDPTIKDTGELYGLLSHEGYPGHAYQTNHLYQHMYHPLQLYLRNKGYDEGWATDAQIFSYGFLTFTGKEDEEAEPLRTLYKDQALMELCLYAISDIYVNVDNHSMQELDTMLREYQVPDGKAETIYHHVIAHPTDYLTYAMGYCLLQEIAEAQGEGTSPQQLHSSLLRFGSCPGYILSSFLKVWERSRQ